jgi:hypothetical protein
VLRWIQETDSSHLPFDEVAHDSLRVVLYFLFTVCAPLEGTSVANRFDLSANRGNMAAPAAIVLALRGVRCAGRTENSSRT